MGKNEQTYAGGIKMRSAQLKINALIIFILFSSGCASLHGSLFMKDPLTAEEHNNLGVIYEREGKLDLAIREYKSAISSDSSLVTPVVNLGNVYFKQGEYTKAEKYYNKALEKDETNLQAANNLASLYIETGSNYKEGLNHMLLAIKGLDTVPPYALDTIGVLYLRLEDRKNAETFLIRACENVGDNPALVEEIRSHLWKLGINKRCGQL